MNRDGRNASDESNRSHDSHSSHSPERLLPPRGNYRALLSFQKAEVIYDITFRFAHKYLARGDRTIDQMIQSARSGKKNILEGSKAALTSTETELKLTNVARARPAALGEKLKRSAVCTPPRPENAAEF